MWEVNYNVAKERAAKEKKTILINFTGSDWCGWCKRLDKEVFSQTAFIEYAQENLVLLAIDFPRFRSLPDTQRSHNKKLYDGYGVGGFPTIVVADKEGYVIGITGYKSGGALNYVDSLKKMIASES